MSQQRRRRTIRDMVLRLIQQAGPSGIRGEDIATHMYGETSEDACHAVVAQIHLLRQEYGPQSITRHTLYVWNEEEKNARA